MMTDLTDVLAVVLLDKEFWGYVFGISFVLVFVTYVFPSTRTVTAAWLNSFGSMIPYAARLAEVIQGFPNPDVTVDEPEEEDEPNQYVEISFRDFVDDEFRPYMRFVMESTDRIDSMLRSTGQSIALNSQAVANIAFKVDDIKDDVSKLHEHVTSGTELERKIDAILRKLDTIELSIGRLLTHTRVIGTGLSRIITMSERIENKIEDTYRDTRELVDRSRRS